MARRPEYGGIISASSMQVMPSDQMSTRVVYSCSQTSSGACIKFTTAPIVSTPCRIAASASAAHHPVRRAGCRFVFVHRVHHLRGHPQIGCRKE